ncbi:MAG: 4Fe-4S binding protein [Candidatus Hadarchaeales archaeon]
MIGLRAERCMGCRICQLVCPTGVFGFSEFESPSGVSQGKCEIVNPERCNSCGKCVSECPGRALFLGQGV